MISTQVGYAGGTKENPTYHSLGDHSETIQIQYDPTVISYSELLEVFWAENSAYGSPISQQYDSIIFYHNDEQKEAAEESYGRRKADNPTTTATEIVPYERFVPAEAYHQKYYLQQYDQLMFDLRHLYASFDDLVASTTAARLNGYMGGFGEKSGLARDIDKYGLSERGKQIVLERANRGLSPGCGMH